MKLTEAQADILSVMSRHRRAWLSATWIAECCSFYGQTSWASKKLPALRRRGLIESSEAGFRITPEGRKTLRAILAARGES